MSREERLAYLERKLERIREAQEKNERKTRERIAEVAVEIEELKISAVS